MEGTKYNLGTEERSVDTHFSHEIERESLAEIRWNGEKRKRDFRMKAFRSNHEYLYC